MWLYFSNRLLNASEYSLRNSFSISLFHSWLCSNIFDVLKEHTAYQIRSTVIFCLEMKSLWFKKMPFLYQFASLLSKTIQCSESTPIVHNCRQFDWKCTDGVRFRHMLNVNNSELIRTPARSHRSTVERPNSHACVRFTV